MRTIDHLIAGKPMGSSRRAPVFDPSTGEQTGAVALAERDIVDHAVTVAREAFLDWRSTTLSRRTSIMFSFRDLLATHQGELSQAITAEHGKVLADAAGEISRGIECVEFACGLSALLNGHHSRQVSSGVDVHEIREPLGVVAGITPFNFPVMVPLWMIPNALACGNTFILKPSEKDPSASLLIAALLEEAGLPPGVFNVLHGDKVAVDCLLEHQGIDAVSFVGSTPIAKYVYQQGTAFGKRVQALGGAKNHMLVMPDADLEVAADAAISAGYGSAGERCMAVSVVVAHNSIADELVDMVKSRLTKLCVGPGRDATSEMGPLITKEHRDRVASYVDLSANEGATIVADGRTLSFDGDGFFLGASLIDHVTANMAVYQNEVFGPMLGVVRVDSFDEGIGLINESPYGNGAAIFTSHGGTARRFEVEVEAGMVGVNIPIPVPAAHFSFGGWKSSLFGDSHMYGHEGIHFYTRTKVVTTRWPTTAPSRFSLDFPSNGT